MSAGKDLASKAAEVQAEAADMSQAEQEKQYFAILADEAATKRGGSKSKRKKNRKK